MVGGSSFVERRGLFYTLAPEGRVKEIVAMVSQQTGRLIAEYRLVGIARRVVVVENGLHIVH